MQVEKIIKEDFWQGLRELLSFEILHWGSKKDPIVLTIGMVLSLILVCMLTSILLRWIQKFITRKLVEEDKVKFASVFSFGKYFVYLIIVLIALDSIGLDITTIFAASAALLVGVGLALQTLIQDVISGVFILIDKTVHVGDIIEVEEKIGRVEEIKLRTTRAITRDNKVLIIPNHKYLSSTLFNWTQNGTMTREAIAVGVAYNSDTALVKQLLEQAASGNTRVLPEPPPLVLFTNFGDSALEFKLIFTVGDSFTAGQPISEIRFEILRLFREHNISIPFPQRDIRMVSSYEDDKDKVTN